MKRPKDHQVAAPGGGSEACDGCTSCDPKFKSARDLRIEGLRHALRWIQGEHHDDFCGGNTKKMCDCGKVLASDQIQDVIRFLKENQ